MMEVDSCEVPTIATTATTATPADQARESEDACLEGIIECMANFLADVLTLRDPNLTRSIDYEPRRLSPNANIAAMNAYRTQLRDDEHKRFMKTPMLGTLMQQELKTICTDEQMEYISHIRELYVHALEAESIALNLMQYSADFLGKYQDPRIDPTIALQGPNVDIKQHIGVACYFFRFSFPRPVRRNVVNIGGICRMVEDAVMEATRTWLERCDRVFCQVHGIQCTDKNEQITKLFDQIAKSIARRHAAIQSPQPNSMSEFDAVLTKRFMQCRSDAEFARCLHVSERVLVQDLYNLNAVHIIALDGGNTARARDVIMKEWRRIQAVIEEPPKELLVRLDDAQEVFAALGPIVKTSEPFMLRCRIASMWAGSESGARARTALGQTIDALNGGAPTDPNAMKVALHGKSHECLSGSLVRMPPLPGADEDAQTGKAWFALPRETTRGRDLLDDTGKRIILMLVFIRQRIEEGGFVAGILHKRFAVNVAAQVMHQSHFMKEIVQMERKHTIQGVRLRVFETSIHDLSSDVSQKLGVSMCYLSNISMEQIQRLFCPGDAIFSHVANKLCRRTRQLVPLTVVGPTYTYHATDCVAFIIKAIETRRLAHGLHMQMKPHPIADLLRTIDKVRNWCPEHGSLIVDLDDLRGRCRFRGGAHPRVRSVLEYHAKRNTSFVNFVSTKANDKVEFVFSTPRLVQLLQMDG